jgi:hypothetical protein
MGLTVKDLHKALKGVPGNTPVYTADHDHSKYEWNGKAGRAELINQSGAERVDKEFAIKGNYFVIRP